MELSVVLAVAAGVTVASVSMGSSMVESSKRAQTNKKLDAIEDALMAYRVSYNRLPCPADPSLAVTDVNYGVEAANQGSCSGGVPAAKQTDSTNHFAEGAIPFQQLKLPEEFMYDGWGRKFVYAVNYRVTVQDSMSNQSVSDQCNGTIYKTTIGGNVTRTSGAMYVLLSYGQDGHGGYLKTGNRNSTGADNADELLNCHCNGTGTEGTYAATYVQKDRTEDSTDVNDLFDNFVRYKERWQMMVPDDIRHTGTGVCTAGFVATGISAWSMPAVGDVNGDGIQDLIIGDMSYNAQAGAIYVLFGTTTGFPNPFNVNTLNGTNGFVIAGTPGGPPGERLGWSVATADFTGHHNGTVDIIATAYWTSTGAGSQQGATYVIIGGSTRKDGNPWTTCTYAAPCSTTTASFTNGTNGIKFYGHYNNDHAGTTLAVGDIFGHHDGTKDIVIGDWYSCYLGTVNCGGNNKGAAFIVFGGTHMENGTGWNSCPCDLQPGVGNMVINGTNGFMVEGLLPNPNGDNLASALATGDINGDGYDDIVIGAAGTGYNGVNSGSVFVIYGGPKMKSGANWNPEADTTLGGTLINGTNGFRLVGATAGDLFGESVATGDLNGDGYADIFITAPAGAYNGANSGSLYVVYGGPTMKDSSAWPNTQTVTLAAKPINGTDGFRIDGNAGDQIGNDLMGWWNSTPVAVGDVNGDGKPDIVIGAETATYAGANTGSAYVIYGGSTMKDGTAWYHNPAYTLSLNGTINNGGNGFRIDFPATGGGGTYTGGGVAIGNLNKATVNDMIFGGNSVKAWVIYGHPNPWVWPNPYNAGGL